MEDRPRHGQHARGKRREARTARLKHLHWRRAGAGFTTVGQEISLDVVLVLGLRLVLINLEGVSRRLEGRSATGKHHKIRRASSKRRQGRGRRDVSTGSIVERRTKSRGQPGRAVHVRFLGGLGDGRRAEVAAPALEAGREGQELVREQRVRLTNVDRRR